RHSTKSSDIIRTSSSHGRYSSTRHLNSGRRNSPLKLLVRRSGTTRHDFSDHLIAPVRLFAAHNLCSDAETLDDVWAVIKRDFEVVTPCFSNRSGQFLEGTRLTLMVRHLASCKC